MRLICPNCDAQYDVADSVIPENGRDVQCSNCANTWFEKPGEPPVKKEDTVVEPPAPQPQATPEPVQEPAPVNTVPPVAQNPAAYQGSIQDAFADLTAQNPDPITAPPPPPLPDAPVRQPVAPDVATILQEEAARETAARREEQAGLESQTDLGLDEATYVDDTPEVAQQTTTTTGAGAVSRRDMLPDIEEINHSLRSNAERGKDAVSAYETPEEQQSNGFRRGFISVLLVIGLFLVIYLYADIIAQQVPATQDMLDRYVALVDSARIWLDVQVNTLLMVMGEA
jgi:predicted Zn finger-like uncharacterized protein